MDNREQNQQLPKSGNQQTQNQQNQVRNQALLNLLMNNPPTSEEVNQELNSNFQGLNINRMPSYDGSPSKNKKSPKKRKSSKSRERSIEKGRKSSFSITSTKEENENPMKSNRRSSLSTEMLLSLAREPPKEKEPKSRFAQYGQQQQQNIGQNLFGQTTQGLSQGRIFNEGDQFQSNTVNNTQMTPFQYVSQLPNYSQQPLMQQQTIQSHILSQNPSQQSEQDRAEIKVNQASELDPRRQMPKYQQCQLQSTPKIQFSCQNTQNIGGFTFLQMSICNQNDKAPFSKAKTQNFSDSLLFQSNPLLNNINSLQLNNNSNNNNQNLSQNLQLQNQNCCNDNDEYVSFDIQDETTSSTTKLFQPIPFQPINTLQDPATSSQQSIFQEEEKNQQNRFENLSQEILLKNLTIQQKLSQITDPRMSTKYQNNGKLNLVLDLDETMINTYLLEPFETTSQINLPLHQIKNFDAGNGRHCALIFRPYLLEFLEQVSGRYNLFCYSHGYITYVQKIIDIIDPKKAYFNRERIFKNNGQVRNDTCKKLNNLDFTSEEARRTLIMDDIRPIWDQDQDKVIPSKKFAPFGQFMDPQKLKQYTLAKTNYSKEEGPPYVILFENDNLHYIDQQHSVIENSSQLKVLASALCEMADAFQIASMASSTISMEQIYAERLRQVLRKESEIYVLSDDIGRRKNFEYLVRMLGGQLTFKDEDAKIVFLDIEKADYLSRRRLDSILQKNQEIKLVSVFWLVESSFQLQGVNWEKYYFSRKNLLN